ncbi:hypothetical protein D5086_024107 [Populus alba]|uniref:Uncharacterized protein n=1 Tax=Populus alba TaxID=43335 RepID=A0ACC4B4J2_POPAL
MKSKWVIHKLNSHILSWATSLTSPLKAKTYHTPSSKTSSFLLNHVDIGRLLSICGREGCLHLGLQALREGCQIHGHLWKLGLQSDFRVESALMDMYSKCGSMGDAMQIFESAGQLDEVSMTIILAGFAQNGFEEEAMQFFVKILEAGTEIDPNMVSAVLGVFGADTSLGLGKQIHSLVIKRSFGSNPFVGNGLINMYSKCGDLEDSTKVFSQMPCMNSVSWNSMIAASARHGDGSRALQLYKEMRLKGVEPTDVTFLSLLHACSHAGLVEKGMEFLKSMTEVHKLTPRMEHYACAVDMLVHNLTSMEVHSDRSCKWGMLVASNVNLPQRRKSIRGEIPDGIGNQSGLVTLNLQENYVDGTIPAACGELRQLQRLNLGSNRLHGFLPDEMEQMEELGVLDVSNNFIAGSIPSWLGKLSQLRYLLTNMDLQGSISPFLSNLSLLTKLSLQSNSFHGEIPTTLGALSQLEYLNMSENKLTGAFPASLHGCQRLKFLDLTTNSLSGVIPEELGSMKNLTFLAISQNNLTGVIPAFLSNLTELTRLEFAVNYFTGKIPSELGALTRLEILYLHMNFLEGAIPASLCNCTALREISLIENWISGELPAEMGNKLQNLQKLYLMNNNISGRIPVTFSNLSQITLLDLSINYLEGEVPQELGKLKNLEILYLHSNNLKLHLGSCLFAGSLPASIGNLSKDLYYFNLLNNRIRGEIPDSIGNLSGLVTLHLWDNRLDGTIPATFGKLKLLQRLYLGRNKLQGSIPDEMGQMENLGLLDLGNNSITGSIPSSLGNLSQLRYLDLSQNSLSGNIPIKLSQCTLMMQLDLSFNNFQGPLPPEITLLANLGLFLNFSNNNLDGEIPASIGKLVSVQAIDLSVNKFSGEVPSTGRFKNLNGSSMIGNAGLCGGSALMRLQPCVVQKKRRKARKWAYYLLAFTISSLLLLIFVWVWVRKLFNKKAEAESEEPILMASPSFHGGRNLTQRELEIATNGFNDANLLGRGSFGSVYKAWIDDSISCVAVKVLNEDNRQSYKSLKRECQILSGIKHRNLVKMMGSIWSSQFKALILEFVDGLDLRKWVDAAFPHHILEIVDMSLKQESLSGDASGDLQKLEQCCLQVLNAGMMCTEENPLRRPPISFVTGELQHTWKEMGFDRKSMAGKESYDYDSV